MGKMIRGIVISDIHFGIKESTRLFKELNYFLKYLKANEFDVLHINGDYFDKKISLNDSVAKYALNFFEKIVRICIDKNIKLRVLQGTRSHDLDQLENFNHYLSKGDLDFKMYSRVNDEDIEGLKFMYVPEEYMPNHREYYAQWLVNKPDVMMGHGTWDFVAFDNQVDESENTNKAAPIFMYDDWKDIGAFAVFGHIHSRQSYKNKVFYPGSYTRWVYGEPKQKGFLTYEIDVETKEYKVDFIDNTYAPIYKDIDFTNVDINSIEITDLIALAKDQLNEEQVSSVRLNLDGLDETKQVLVRKALGDSSDIKVKIKAKKNFNIDKDYLEYDFIEDDSLTMSKKIQMYIKKEFNKELDEDFINANIVKDDEDK